MTRVLFFLLLCLCGVQSQAHRCEVVLSNDRSLWCEAFGEPENPAILLISGGGDQCIMWYDTFCEKLASQGFLVIRYDQRDVGLSTCLPYENQPYTTLDLAKDAVGILEHYHISQAHLVGMSMGGQIAGMIAAHFPDRVASLTMMMSSPDFAVFFATRAGRPTTSKLSPPDPKYIEWTKHMLDGHDGSRAAYRRVFLHTHRLLNGAKTPFDEALFIQLAEQDFARLVSPQCLGNHTRAMQASHDLYHQALLKIQAPTLIVHGDQDPVFGPDHAQALAQQIKGATLAIIPDMGHILTPHFEDQLISLIVDHASSSASG